MKWFLVLAAVVCQLAAAEATDQCESGRVWCLECKGYSEAECNAEATWVDCAAEAEEAVCKEQTILDGAGETKLFTRSCEGRAECQQAEDTSLTQCGEHTGISKRSTNLKLEAGQRKKRDSPIETQICTSCIEASCIDCPTSEPLQCFTCSAFSEIACWISGRYEECGVDSLCAHTVVEMPNDRFHISRGCQAISSCTPGMLGHDAYECEDKTCRHCGIGENNGFSLEKPASKCGPPTLATCSCKGDPHCVTFDGKPIAHLPGACWHTFARDGCTQGLPTSLSPEFIVSIKLEHLSPTKVVVQWVRIEVGRTELLMGPDVSTFTVNGQTEDISSTSAASPYTTSGHSVAMTTSTSVLITLSNGVSVEWDFNRQVAVHIPESVKAEMCGVCGDADGSTDNDLKFGPRRAASYVCPNKAKEFAHITSGSQAGPGDEELFSYSWVNKVVVGDALCESECNK